MDLVCASEPGLKYRSNAQIARVVTENWCARQMYCPACSSNALTAAPNNYPGVDFHVPEVHVGISTQEPRSQPLKNRVVDAGYDAMIRAIRSERVPNLFLLRYSSAWSVIDLLLVPSFFFTESAIEKRRPLSANARRAGWVGCNILLDNIPVDGRIAVVSGGVAASPSHVQAGVPAY